MMNMRSFIRVNILPGYRSSAIVRFLVCACMLNVVDSSPRADSEQQQSLQKTVLVFGGNGFIGASTVENMIRVNYSVVIINRGNWYWDAATRIKPHVKHIKCDRMQSLQRCSGLQHYLWGVDAPTIFDAVVDFSAFHAFEITEALNMLKGKILKYIYISSDSVYEVCNKTHSENTREEDAVRPTSTEEQESLKQKDNYGHRKLECEEELQKQFSKDEGVPYISLRLPDVVGPRDNTYRWWLYQLWIKLSSYLDKQLSVPRVFWNQPMSMVYVNDVADVILDCIYGGEEINNQAYNLALNEMPTLAQYLHSLMDVLDVEDIDIQEDFSEEGFHLFPSVKFGPLDTTKAKRLLNWNPTSWIDVLDETVTFYEAAMSSDEFESPRKDVIRTLQQHFSKDPSNVIRGLNAVYGITFTGKEVHDEL